MALRRLLLLAFLAAALAPALTASAQSDQRVEVVEVNGLIDASIERMINRTIDRAEADDADLVLLQIDSNGSIDARRTARLVRKVRDAEVPVAAWIGPPGASASNGAAMIYADAPIRAMAPGTAVGPVETADLRADADPGRVPDGLERRLTVGEAEDEGAVGIVEASLRDVIAAADEDIDPDEATVRFNELDLLGRMLHGAAQPSITYLLLLLAIVGIVFELFHPSTGPAGVTALVALALSLYGVVTLGGSWVAVALIFAGVAAMCVDLRFSSLGPFTAGGLAALIAGSLLLFRSPWLRVNPWVLAFGIVSTSIFMISVMTRVLRDLRAVARGELEVRDAHEHLEEGNHDA